jgi:hypothetical protein
VTGLSDLFEFRDLQQFFLHDLTRGANALSALVSNGNKLAKLLKGLWLKLAHCLTNFFITYTVTQANVHMHSRSKSAQSVNENSYDYNSTSMSDALLSG